MAGPQNAIIGDDFGTDIPVTNVDDQQLNDEKKAAKYSRSAEYKKLQEHMQARIDFYQKYLPDGSPVGTKPISIEDWKVANAVIAELSAVLNYYKTANDVVKSNAVQ